MAVGVGGRRVSTAKYCTKCRRKYLMDDVDTVRAEECVELAVDGVVVASPGAFGQDRRRPIYSTPSSYQACRSLHNFRSTSSGYHVLYPVHRAQAQHVPSGLRSP